LNYLQKDFKGVFLVILMDKETAKREVEKIVKRFLLIPKDERDSMLEE